VIGTRSLMLRVLPFLGVTIALVLAPSMSSAQSVVPSEGGPSEAVPSRFEVGVKLGASLTSLTNVSVVSEKRNDVGGVAFVPEGSVFAGLRISDRLGLQCDVTFATRAARLPDDSSADDRNDERRLSVRYLEIPLQLKVTAPGTTTKSLYFLMGPTVSRRLSASLSTGDQKEVVTDRVLEFAWGASAAVGIQGRHWQVEARFSQGLRHIAVEDDKERVWPRAISVMTGVRF